jgi:2-polyprenyl-6-methoxyphenol hydroxylase-like FAD-dependent oxidoreductase
MDQTKVLIVGAGPTGLTLALWLTKAGIPIRIIDKTEKPGTTSRAMVLHARNLEFYHQLGIDQIAITGGLEMKTINLWIRGKHVRDCLLVTSECIIVPTLMCWFIHRTGRSKCS